MPVQPNATFTFSAYEVMDIGIRLDFVCLAPGPGEANDYTVLVPQHRLRGGPYPLFRITRTGTTATAQMGEPHDLITGDTVVIAGADVAAYNGAVAVTVSSETAFTFQVAGSPATPATGSLVYGTTLTQAMLTRYVRRALQERYRALGFSGMLDPLIGQSLVV